MPFGGSGPPWQSARAVKPSAVRDARYRQRVLAERLKSDLEYRFHAPKQRGYRPFLLKNAKAICRLLLTKPEREFVREEMSTWVGGASASQMLEVDVFQGGAAWNVHIDINHPSTIECPDCFADLIDIVLRRRSLGTLNGPRCYSSVTWE